MANVKDTHLEDALIADDMTIVDYCCEKVEGQYERAKAKDADYLWTIEIQLKMWQMFRDAHKNGKKAVWFGGPVPTDIIAAFDCVPIYLDTVPIRLSPSPLLASRFIDAAHKYAPQTMCGIDAVQLGMTLLNQFGPECDAFVYSSVPCDSSRIAYPNMEKLLKVPTFVFDQPYRRDDRGVEYLVAQQKRFITWMENFTGAKFDMDKLKAVMEKSNRSFRAQGAAADLRKHKPCPLPGRMLVMNGTSNAMSCFDAMGDLLEKEIEVGQMLIDLGMGPCPNGEKHRVALQQNMLWSSAGTIKAP